MWVNLVRAGKCKLTHAIVVCQKRFDFTVKGVFFFVQFYRKIVFITKAFALELAHFNRISMEHTGRMDMKRF